MSGDAPAADAAQGKPKKSKMIAIIIGVAVLLVVGGAGAVLAPKFMAPSKAEKSHKGDEEGHEESEEHSKEDSEEEGESGEHESESEEEAEEGESHKKTSGKEEPPLSVEWPPLVVDVRDEGGAAHHLKLVVTIECKDEHATKAVQGFSFRARAKVLEYIRSQPYEELTDGAKFGALQTKISKLVKECAGKNAKNVWITDFVAQ
jgi:flagellar basal body-associated protein FliL